MDLAEIRITTNQRPTVFVKSACYSKIFTKITVLTKDDPCCEGINVTDARWVYTSCNLVEKRSEQFTKFLYIF